MLPKSEYLKTLDVFLADKDGSSVHSTYTLNVILEAIERTLGNALTKLRRNKINVDVLENMVYNASECGIVVLEDKFFYRIGSVAPNVVLRGKNVVGVDGGVFSLLLYPIRFVIARSGVFSLSMRSDRKFNVRGIWRVNFSILEACGSVDDKIRRKVREVLVSVESRTVREIATEYGGEIDVVFWDGPMYTRRFFRETYAALKALGDRAIMCVRVVKNPFASKLARAAGIDALSDADIFSFFLDPNTRTAMFLYDGETVRNVPRDYRPVFMYIKTSQRVVFRYEFPYWMLEEYGSDAVLDIIYADLALGNGLSYMVGRADSLARFSDEEKRYIAFRIFTVLKNHGFSDFLTFNQRRWGRFLSKWDQK